jgi:hypothetical protein
VGERHPKMCVTPGKILSLRLACKYVPHLLCPRPRHQFLLRPALLFPSSGLACA